MLTAADEWHVHQTPEPIAVAGTDRNFYDRSYFGGWTPPDGRWLFAIAFGIYPHVNIADAHLTIVRDGSQHCLHASKILHSDRATLSVGPVSHRDRRSRCRRCACGSRRPTGSAPT